MACLGLCVSVLRFKCTRFVKEDKTCEFLGYVILETISLSCTSYHLMKNFCKTMKNNI
uniref:Uncharacterized protein n=1 Tax=Arundo donax TaxID=35708 RepID=A0A0A8YEC4_ARUDO